MAKSRKAKKTISSQQTERVLTALKSIVGNAFVAADAGTRYIYSQDLTEAEPHEPMAVVMPESVEQVQALVRLANEEKIPLTPFATGLNMGGLAIPLQNGIIVDLKRMRTILEVNEEDMYALVEPGVTFGHIRAYLDEHHPQLQYAYPLAPPHTSVMCNALLDGLNNLSFKHGAMGEWVSGLEVVLPDGELVRVGSAAITDCWQSREPLPDLSGLFLGWHGLTGIVTKAALNLWDKPPYQHRSFLPAYDPYSAYRAMRELGRMEIYDDLACVSWPASKMLFGARDRLTLQTGEPELFIYAALSGYSKKELKAKRELSLEVIKRQKRLGGGLEFPLDVEDLIKINPGYAKLAEFPTTLDFLLDYGPGGFTWLGTYGPGHSWAEGAEKIFKILEAEGFPPLLVSRPMKHGHFWVLRFIMHFDRQDPQDIERVRRTLSRMGDAALALGYIPYKPPVWAVEKIRARDGHNFFRLLERIKTALDPNGIMNPGRWGT